MRIVVIGNAGGGKSTLAKRLSKRHSLPYHEIDKILWKEGWQLASESDYDAAHNAIIKSPTWILDGLGRMDTLECRLLEATHIVHIDLPVWQHYLLAANRHAAWERGEFVHTPGDFKEMPQLELVFKMISTVDADYTPKIRQLLAQLAAAGVTIQVVDDYANLDAFKLTP